MSNLRPIMIIALVVVISSYLGIGPLNLPTDQILQSLLGEFGSDIRQSIQGMIGSSVWTGGSL